MTPMLQDNYVTGESQALTKVRKLGAKGNSQYFSESSPIGSRDQCAHKHINFSVVQHLELLLVKPHL